MEAEKPWHYLGIGTLRGERSRRDVELPIAFPFLFLFLLVHLLSF